MLSLTLATPPKKLTVYSGYTFFISMCVPWELNPQPFTLLMQCSTAEPQEHFLYNKPFALCMFNKLMQLMLGFALRVMM